ncbi:MAG: secondary thiamine-phosphate synthase enzyme YjbQ [Pseudomonadales bacterium]|nr:secondary thiamine-phosphate synthase enzyme YjbQ [Pseudomonadales bacterium]
MWVQREVKLRPYPRGFHLVTEEIIRQFPEINRVNVGVFHVFIKHTSASLTINENADPTVRQDFEQFFNRCIPENEPYYIHTYEGPDDLPAHLKSSVLGSNLTIPVTDGHLNMGTWQGIYLCEHRNRASGRSLVLTLMGDS